MGTSAVFGQAVFGQAVFGSSGGTAGKCYTQTHTAMADYISDLETVTDTNYLGGISFRERGTRLDKLVNVRKV